ncbi:retrovirus-related pol polyprotein from transposon TNT 1-94 [Tanacetum coccineum]
MVPKAVLMRSSLVSLTTARPVNTAQPKTTVNSARPMTNVFNKAHSTVRRPINNKTTTKNNNFYQKVNTARPKAILNAVKRNQVNAVNASACWVWKPKTKIQEKRVIDSGCSRHMIGNMSYLTNFEEINGGYVAFGDDYCRSRVKVIRCDNRTEFKNKEMNQFCGEEKSMNYKPVVAGNQSNGNAGIKACDDACKARIETVPGKDYILLPLWLADLPFSQNSKSSPDAEFKPSGDNEKKVTEEPGKEGGDSSNDQEKEDDNDPKLDRGLCRKRLLHCRYRSLDPGGFTKWKRPIGTKWIYRNRKDERGIVIRNKARLVAQGYTQEEGIDYDEVFAPVVRIEVIRLFLAYASFKDFVVYQMDVKSAFIYGKIEEEVYVYQPSGFEDPDFPDRVYKVEKALYGLHQAPRSLYMKSCHFFVGQWLYKEVICTKFEKIDAIRVSDGSSMGSNSHSSLGLACKAEAKHSLWKLKTPFATRMKMKLTVVANSPKNIEAEYRAAFSLLDSNEKKLIQMIKIHTDKNVADLLTKAFDKGIGVNAGDSKLMLLGINLLLLGKVNAARHNLLLLVIRLSMRRGMTVWKRATTTATGLDAEHNRGNISKTQSKATPNEPSSIGSRFRNLWWSQAPRTQGGITIAQTRSENVSKFSNDLLLAGVNTPRSGEDSLQLKELMKFCTKLQQRVLDLENTKTAQAQEITSLKKRVKKLERKKIRRCHPNWGGKIDVIDADEDHHPGRKCHDADCFECMILMCCQRFIDVDMTLTQDNANLKSTKHKAVTILLTTTTTAELKTKLKGLLFKRRSMASTPITSSKDKELVGGSEVERNAAETRRRQAGDELEQGGRVSQLSTQRRGETLEEAYYTQFGAPYQPRGQYKAAGPEFYQRNNGNSSYPDRRQTREKSLTKFMAESPKRHEENSNIIKESQASTDATIRNQGASIKTLEIQIG